MRNDWVKIRSDLYRHPKVIIMADELMDRDCSLALYVRQYCQCDMAITRNVMRNAVVGALTSVWGVFRHRGRRIGDDLVVDGAAMSVVDDVAELPGFGAVMAAVGWANQKRGIGLIFPDFFKDYNVDPAENTRLKNAERQRRFREKNKPEDNAKSNVTVTLRSNGVTAQSKRESKSKREEETPLPPLLDTERFRKCWAEWKADRKARKKPLTKLAESKQLKQLAAWGEPKAVAAIEASIANSWQGLFEPKSNAPPMSKSAQRDNDFARLILETELGASSDG